MAITLANGMFALNIQRKAPAVRVISGHVGTGTIEDPVIFTDAGNAPFPEAQLDDMNDYVLAQLSTTAGSSLVVIADILCSGKPMPYRLYANTQKSTLYVYVGTLPSGAGGNGVNTAAQELYFGPYGLHGLTTAPTYAEAANANMYTGAVLPSTSGGKLNLPYFFGSATIEADMSKISASSKYTIARFVLESFFTNSFSSAAQQRIAINASLRVVNETAGIDFIMAEATKESADATGTYATKTNMAATATTGSTVAALPNTYPIKNTSGPVGPLSASAVGESFGTTGVTKFIASSPYSGDESTQCLISVPVMLLYFTKK